MLKLIARRIVFAIFTLFLVSLIVFFAIEALPGDMATAYLGRDATPESLAHFREEFNLNRPMHIRYLEWFSHAIQGDLGQSLAQRKPIIELVRYRLRNTIVLATMATLIGIPLAIISGIIAALTRDKWPDITISTLSILGMTLPEFVIATFLIFFFGIRLRWFPVAVIGASDAPITELIPNIWLPILTLTCVMVAHIMRLVRTSLIDVMRSDYVTMAQFKGAPMRQVVFRHALPNAMLPTINIIALTAAWLLTGTVIIEEMFNFPGMGTLMIRGITARDLPLVQGIVIIFAAIYTLINLTADLVTLLLNPRLRTIT